MAIAFDASSSGNSSGSGSYTYSHTCSGSDRYLVVATSSTATAVTYNGTSLSLVGSYTPTFPAGTNCPGIKVWGLKDPTTGSNTIEVTSGADCSAACSYTGVSAYPPEASNQEDSANNQVSTFSSTVTTVTPDAMRVSFFIGGNNFPNTFTAGSGTTLRVSRASFSAPAIGILDSGSPVTTPASTTLNTSWSAGSGFVTSYGLSLAPLFESKGSFLQYF